MESGTFSVTLFRDVQFVPWGFRLQGGSDHAKPLQIQRVFPGSPADGHLQRGDIVMRVQNHDTSSMTHLEAHDMFKNAGNQVNLTVHRDHNPGQLFHSTGHQVTHVIPNFGHLSLRKHSLGSHTTRPKQVNEVREIKQQAYRTLPLITPSVKVKRDLPIGSYLRFQYDPKAGPPNFDGDSHVDPFPGLDVTHRFDAAMKQSVADAVTNVAATKFSGIPITEDKTLVNKQFNSPINLYSKENVQKSAQEQTGLTPPGIPVPKHYDPMKSPTYHALQAMEDRREQVPVHTKVYAAPVPPPGKEHHMHVGLDGKILQSYSFNRVMMDVLGESAL